MTTIPTTIGIEVNESTTPITELPGWSIDVFNETFNLTEFQNESQHCNEGTQSAVTFYTVLSTIFVIGIVGNSLLIFIFLRHKSMRTAPNTYIFNLAVADLLTTVSCASAPMLLDIGNFVPGLCKFFQAVMETSFGVTSYTLVALSAERYIAIAHPLMTKKKALSSKKFIFCVVTLIWSVCLCYILTKMFLKSRNNQFECVQMFDPSTFLESYTLIDFFGFYLIPLIIITIFYILMAVTLFSSTGFVKKNGPLQSRHVQVRKKIAGVVLVLAAIFAIFYFPFNFLNMKLYLQDEPQQAKAWAPLTNVLFCVGCLQNSLNPIVLYFLSDSFREHFKNYLFYPIFPKKVPAKKEHINCKCIACIKKSSSTKITNTISTFSV